MIARIESGAQSMLSYFGSTDNWQWQHKVISETPGQRLVAHYMFQPDIIKTNTETVETVGKFYADVEIGQHCYRAMRAVYDQISQQGNAPLTIPEPLFFDEDNQLLTLKWVSCQPFYDLIAKPGFERHFQLAGKALACLHKLPATYGVAKTLKDHLAELMTPHPLTLAQKLPDQALRINTIIQCLLEAESQLVMPNPVPLHRDFHLRQLFCEQNKIWLIDWDMYALGDPALDIGNFMTYLETKIPNQSNSAIAAFLEGYRSIQPNICTQNIRLYQALTYLRLACKAYRLQTEQWEKRVYHYLITCENLLTNKESWQ